MVAEVSVQPVVSLASSRRAILKLISAGMITLLMGCSRPPSTTAPGGVVEKSSTSDQTLNTTESNVTEIQLTEPIEPLPPMSVTSEDWPWWRGFRRDCVSTGGAPVTQWQEDKNILWKVRLSGRGSSSPIGFQSHIYLTTCNEADPQDQSVVAFDANTGEQIWQTSVHTGGFTEKMHPKASYADATLACDGEQLFAVFLNDASIRVTALTLDGKIAWTTNAGSYTTVYGYGASPVLFESFVIVIVDDPVHASISALHRKTGEVCWRVARPAGTSYSSPVVAQVAGRWQLLINGKKTVSSYDPTTGELLWSHESPAAVACNTMAFAESVVFSSGGIPAKETACFHAAVNLNGPRLVWRQTKSSSTCYVPSVLYYDHRLFNLNDDGVLSCFDSQKGKQLFQKRLGGNFSASPVIANGNLIVINEAGTAWVLRAAPPFETLSENKIESGVLATPTIFQGCIYLRSEHHLYCVGLKG